MCFIANLDNNCFGNEGMKELAKADWKSIEIISLNYNDFDEEGLVYLLKIKRKTLKEFLLTR